jgi:hypothetical protein
MAGAPRWRLGFARTDRAAPSPRPLGRSPTGHAGRSSRRSSSAARAAWSARIRPFTRRNSSTSFASLARSSSLKQERRQVGMTHCTGDLATTACVEAPLRIDQALGSPLWRLLADRWQRCTDRQLAASVAALDHPGIAADFKRAQQARLMNAGLELGQRRQLFCACLCVSAVLPRRLTDIGSQYFGAFVDSRGEYLDGSKTYKVTLPPNIPAAKFWSFTVYDIKSRSMLETPQPYPRSGSQRYPGPAATRSPTAPPLSILLRPSRPA